MSTILRRRVNRIEALRDHDDIWCTEETRIKRLVVDHFRGLFSVNVIGPAFSWPNIIGFPPLAPEVIQDLEKPFSGSYIQLALKAMQPFKAPGPDGF